MRDQNMFFAREGARQFAEIPHELQGPWAVVAARLQGEVLTGEVLDVWTIGERAVRNSAGSFNVTHIEVMTLAAGSRLCLLTMGATGMQCAAHLAPGGGAILAITWLWAEERTRCLLTRAVPGLKGDWTRELAAAEGRFPFGALQEDSVFAMETQEELLVFEDPGEDAVIG